MALRRKLATFKPKSPALAGILSTIVPGLGKLYAGRKGEAMTAFSINLIFAGFTAEAYIRTKRFDSPQFITFATLFTFFYSGNIIGSIHSAKRQNKNVKKQIQNEILANMHVSVAHLFE